MKKRLLNLKKLLLIGGLLSAWSTANAQTATCVVVHQPCHSDGELIVNTTGFTAPVTYTYYSGGPIPYSHTSGALSDTVQNISDAILGVYVVDTHGHSFYLNPTGMVPPFTIDLPVVTDAICPSLTGTAQFTINGGTAPALVEWYDMSGVFAGSGNPITLPSGSYSATITDASGCTIPATDSLADIFINNVSGISFTTSRTNANCTDGTATVTGISGGMAPYTYAWSNGATTSSISGLVQGNYGISVTDAQGCHTDNSINVPQAISIATHIATTAATCLQNDGSAIAFPTGGTAPYSYLWSNGTTTQSAPNLTGSSSVTVTVTDANGCTGLGYTYINSTSPVYVTYTTTNSSCTAPTGSATLSITGGTAPYTVVWGTWPVMSGTTVSGLAEGSYGFTVTDANGCVKRGIVSIGRLGTLTASAHTVSPVCPAVNGTLVINATGSNPPFSYAWNNGATTTSVTGVPTGSYSCVITDNVGCRITQGVTLTATSPVTVGLSSTSASCIFSADGSVFASPHGGTSPYTYHWSNGSTSPTVSGLPTGYYYVTVTDANGCRQQSPGGFTHISYNVSATSCYCTITGKVYKDLNGNCLYDSGEPGIQHIMVNCSGRGNTFTDVHGNYSFQVPSGSYTITEIVQPFYPLTTCQSNNIPVTATASTGCVNTVNFANDVIAVHDLNIHRWSSSAAIPGNSFTQALLIANDGTVPESDLQLGFSDNLQLNYWGTSPNVYTQPAPVAAPGWYNVTSGFPILGASLEAGESEIIQTFYHVAPTVPLGTVLDFRDTAAVTAPLAGWLNDNTPWNNISDYYTNVVNGYDPNFKEVSPQGVGPEGYIETKDSVMDYVVHFQNTGTYYAQNVVVIDTLDSNLDWTTVRPGYSDHNYTATMSEDGVLTFTFDNINLDWKDDNDITSRGLISYSVKQKPGLSEGTQIKNSAAIYFDYNAPVITNQTLNTIALSTGIAETKTVNNISIYPNPATQEITIAMEHAENIAAITVYDLQGRVVQTEAVNKNNNVQKIDISNLMNGIYFIELKKADGQKITGRFIKN